MSNVTSIKKKARRSARQDKKAKRETGRNSDDLYILRNNVRDEKFLSYLELLKKDYEYMIANNMYENYPEVINLIDSCDKILSLKQVTFIQTLGLLQHLSGATYEKINSDLFNNLTGKFTPKQMESVIGAMEEQAYMKHFLEEKFEIEVLRVA